MTDTSGSVDKRTANIPPLSRLFTVPEVAELLATSERTTRRLIARGDLTAIRIGEGRSSYRIPASALEAFVLRFGDLEPDDVAAVLNLDELTLGAGRTPARRDQR